MSKPSAILMGSKAGAVVALWLMLERGWDVKAVVTPRKNLHPWISGPTLGEFAAAHGIRVMTQGELPRDLISDFVISYMYRNRVKAEVISMARRAALNFHAGPLPEFGGWAFYSVAILENSREYGCTCHYMDNGFDTGPLLKVRRFPLDASRETALSLERKAQAGMVRLFGEFCEMAESGDELPCEEQEAMKMRYLSREAFEALKRIPADADAETVDRYARAFWYPPYQCALARSSGQEVEIIPEIAKRELAALLHTGDFEDLKKIAAELRESVAR